MQYSIFSILILSFLTLPLGAQPSQQNIPRVIKPNDGIPSGWKMRLDHQNASMDGVKFTINNGEYHFEIGPSQAAIYYKPDMKASGSYSMQAQFTQLAKTDHPEAYGIFIGGKNLQESNQEYLYFLIRQDGKYLIKRRSGSDTQTISGWTASNSVKALGNMNEVTNTLKITCTQDAVKFMANGEVLKTVPKSQLNYLNGIAGLRVNHHLHLNVNNFELNTMD